MPRSLVPLLAVVLTLAALPGAAGVGPYLVADLDTTPIAGSAFSQEPIEWAELGGFLYFAADDGRHGHELWRTDGTLSGTQMVTDLCPGPCSSLPRELKVFGGRIAFNATDGFHGTEIWLSDGTREGTRMPLDLCPGSCSAIYPGWSDPVLVGGRLFFVGRQPAGQTRLAITDGTAAGTRWLTEAQQRPLVPIGELGGRLAFWGHDPSSALWLSDGTPEGTATAVELCTEPCAAGWWHANVVEDRIVFFRTDLSGFRAWVSDGTLQGTREIGNVHPPLAKIVWKGALYFATPDGLWRSDGTPSGTFQLRPFPFVEPVSLVEWSPRDFIPLGDSLLFVAGTEGSGLAVWRTRGTLGSTEMVFDPVLGPDSPDLGTLTRVGNRVLFPVRSGGTVELWETDGSAMGTRRVAQICGTGQIQCASLLGLQSPISLGQTYLFGLDEATAGRELWAFDGSAVRLVRDIFRQPGSGRPGGIALDVFEGSGDPLDLAALGNRFVFSAKTAAQGPARLWASDGTAAGTVEIGKDVAWPHGLVQIGSRLWLRGSFPNQWPYFYGRDLWTTDGTAAGTQIVRTGMNVGSSFGGRPGLVLFAGDDQEVPFERQSGLELWASNGAAAGTGLVKDIRPGQPVDSIGFSEWSSSFPDGFTALGNHVLFAADDGVTGREPWITDGTAASTRLLRDVNPAPSDGVTWLQGWSSPGPFVRFGGRAWFAADDSAHGRELWITDGTAAGTLLARDLRPGTAGSAPRDLVPMGAALFFLADSGTADGLWTVSSNGQVKRIRLLAKGQRASSLVAAGSRLFFVVDDPATGPELWTSTGTRAGTRKVLDIRPGPLGSYPQELTAVENRLLFAADDGVHGLELWVSDGTAAGTRLLGDLAPGPAASAPRGFTLAGDLVAFDADDGVHGRELWAISKADVAGEAFPAGGGGK